MPHRGRTTAILLATGAVVVLLLAAVSFRRDVGLFLQSDAGRIEGRWKIVSMVGPRYAVDEDLLGYCVFEDGKWWFFGPDDESGNPQGASMAHYRLDEDHEPGRLYMIEGGIDWAPAIYELSRDTLRLCIKMEDKAGEWPTAFEANADSNSALWVLQRE